MKYIFYIILFFSFFSFCMDSPKIIKLEHRLADAQTKKKQAEKKYEILFTQHAKLAQDYDILLMVNRKALRDLAHLRARERYEKGYYNE